MNWFAGIIASIINALANGISALVSAVVSVHGPTNSLMGNIIMSGFFHDASKAPMWGAGNFADLMDPKSVDSLRLFALSFWSFGWTFFLVSIYLLAMQVSSAHESAIQRERWKKGIASLFVSSILIWQGGHLAVLVTQFFYYMSDYFLTLNPLVGWTPPNGGNQALLDSSVNLFQAVLSIIVWVVYQFRQVFLVVWMLYFPLAMSFYANDKTRSLAKMWWAEWIYQMAIPFGQAVVFGVASAVAHPSSAAALTAEDVFVSLAGTIGLLSSAVYVRKLVDTVAQGFGASLIGSGHGMAWGSMAMMGAAALTGDMMGKASVKAGRATAGKAIGKGFQKIDNTVGRKLAKGAVEKYGEVHAKAIQAGASMDDIMMAQKLGGSGDAVQSGGVGLETAVSGSRGYGGSSMDSRGGAQKGGGRHPLKPVLHSRTAGEIGVVAQDVKSALRNSNFGVWATTKKKGIENEGGIMGKVGGRIAPKLGGQRAQEYMAKRTNQKARLDTLRSHMAEVMQNNEHAQRVPGISANYDPENNTFQGMSSPAERRYSEASSQFVHALQSSGLSYTASQDVLEQSKRQWDVDKHLPSLNSYTPQVQEAYRQAFTAYRPAQQDIAAKKAVLAGKVVAMPPKDQHKNKVAQSSAFLNDARNAIMYKR